jgi:hypothetical protein
MLNITSAHLRSEDKDMIRKYARFVLDRLVRKGIQNKSRVTIKVLNKEEMKTAADLLDLKTYKAWCTYDGSDDFGNKKFTIVLNAHTVNRKAKKSQIRLKNLLIDLGHELVHVKQYLLNEMFDYTNGDVRHKGIVFSSEYQENEELYYDSPWEIEAYGRELGLYKIFCHKLKEDVKK